MDRFEKRVYKFLKKQPAYGFKTSMYDPEGFDKADFIRACEQLVLDGYAVKAKTGYALTHKGVHKLEIDIRAFMFAFFSKFVVGLISGIAIGVFTTLLVQFLLRQGFPL